MCIRKTILQLIILFGGFTCSLQGMENPDSLDKKPGLGLKFVHSFPVLERSIIWSGAIKPYRWYTSTYLDLRLEPEINVWESNEWRLAKQVAGKSWKPVVVLAEFTVYPTAVLSPTLAQTNPGLYRRFDLTSELNLLRTLATEYQEPWSISLFGGYLANFIDINERDEIYIAANGVAGWVWTFGVVQQFDNYLVPGFWHRLEWKLKGDDVSLVNKKRSWDIKIGYRWFGQESLADAWTFSVYRYATNRAPGSTKWLENSIINSQVQISGAGQVKRTLVSAGKLWGWKNHLWGLMIGIDRQYRKRYDGTEFTTDTVRETHVVLKPLVQW